MSAGDDKTGRRERTRVPEMRRRIAATASVAAIAVGGGVGAASAAGSPVRAKPQTRIAGSERTNGADDMTVIARREQAEHRRHLAHALADQLPGAEADRVDAALASTDRLLIDGARFDPSAELARRIGVGEDEIGDAFEAMSRRALERRANR